MNTAALIGFISSLVICIPLLTQLLGLVLGIVGIVGTSGGRARGRGLAVAATIISPLAALGWVVMIFMIMTVAIGAFALSEEIVPLLQVEDEDLPQVVAEVREATFSLRLKNQVSEADVLAFVKGVVATHGRLDSFQPRDPPMTQLPGGQGMVLHAVGRFAEGSADVDITIGFDGIQPEIDNIRIGDLVLAPEQ
jgi:hypothetical protein